MEYSGCGRARGFADCAIGFCAKCGSKQRRAANYRYERHHTGIERCANQYRQRLRLHVFVRANRLVGAKRRVGNDQSLELFAGLELVEPGVTPVSAWRAQDEPEPRPNPAHVSMYAGVGRKP